MRKGIQEEGEYLSLHIHVLDHNSASIGMATINIRVMIDESCSVLRQVRRKPILHFTLKYALSITTIAPSHLKSKLNSLLGVVLIMRLGS